MKALIIPFVVLLVVALIAVSLSIRLVTQYEKGVLFRLGKVVGVTAQDITAVQSLYSLVGLTGFEPATT